MHAFYALNRTDDLDATAPEPVETSLEDAIRLLSQLEEDGHLGLVLQPTRLLQFRKEGPGRFWMELLDTPSLRTRGTHLGFPAGVIALRAAYSGGEVEAALAGHSLPGGPLRWEDAQLDPQAEQAAPGPSREAGEREGSGREEAPPGPALDTTGFAKA